MKVTIEFASWPASDAYIADPKAVLNDLADVIAIHTFGFYHGVLNENNRLAYLVISEFPQIQSICPGTDSI